VRIHESCVLIDCENISIGENVRLDPFCILTVRSHLTIGSHVHISGHVAIVGVAAVSIGDFAALSHGVKLLTASDDFDGAGIGGPMVPEIHRQVTIGPIAIGRHAIVGTNAVILPGVTVGEGATIGALSLAKDDIEAWTVNAGAPARAIGTRPREAVLAAERTFVDSTQ